MKKRLDEVKRLQTIAGLLKEDISEDRGDVEKLPMLEELHAQFKKLGNSVQLTNIEWDQLNQWYSFRVSYPEREGEIPEFTFLADTNGMFSGVFENNGYDEDFETVQQAFAFANETK